MASRFPFPSYPTGWFQAAFADDLPAGGIVPLQVFGRELVLYRATNGKPHILTAHCPHLGAHLGHGRVEGSAVRCPFHGWEFDGSGRCVGIPYSQRIPALANVESWPVDEANGLIWVSFGDPAWSVPQIAEMGHPEGATWLRRHWTFRTHVQEIVENSVDIAHFPIVHGALMVPHDGLETDGWVARSHYRVPTVTPAGNVLGAVHWEAHGLGLLQLRFSGVIDALVMVTPTPVDGESISLRLTARVAAPASSGQADAFFAEIVQQVEQDKAILENKVYLAQPVLCDGDGAIMAYRKWCRQFYQATAEQ